MIKKYRNQLSGTFKELDRLDLMLEVDHEFDKKRKKMYRKKNIPYSGNTISGLNVNRSGVVKVSSCRLREFPNGKAKVLGSYGRGRKLNMSYHNNKWWAIVYSGQKAFIGKECVRQV